MPGREVAVFSWFSRSLCGLVVVMGMAGAVYLFNPDLQLDVRAARRLTNEGVDLLIGAGISCRLGGRG